MDAAPTEALLQYLTGGGTDRSTIEKLLAASWDGLNGDDGGMAGYKLLNRMENVSWRRPVLSFSIERHGGTVMGSTRAELQHWEVDVEKQTATIVKVGHRQLSPMAERVYIKPLAGELLDAIRSGKKDERLAWIGKDEVILRTSDIFPTGSAWRMTLDGRSRGQRPSERRLGAAGQRPFPSSEAVAEGTVTKHSPGSARRRRSKHDQTSTALAGRPNRLLPTVAGRRPVALHQPDPANGPRTLRL